MCINCALLLYIFNLSAYTALCVKPAQELAGVFAIFLFFFLFLTSDGSHCLIKLRCGTNHYRC